MNCPMLKLGAAVLCATLSAAASVRAHDDPNVKGWGIPYDPNAASVGQPPANDLCINAEPLGPVPAVVTGSTLTATVDGAPTCGNPPVMNNAPGVWYSVIGTGKSLVASTCASPLVTTFDTKLSIYCLDCAAPTCVGANDDIGNACTQQGGSGVMSRVTWCSQYGAEYLILVHGFAAVGQFQLTVSETGPFCDAPVDCGGSPRSGCCFLSQPCVNRPIDLCCLNGGYPFQPLQFCLGDANGNGIDERCEYTGDLTGDLDVDWGDWQTFRACLNGPTLPPPLGCGRADLTANGRVDMYDVRAFINLFTGSLPHPCDGP